MAYFITTIIGFKKSPGRKNWLCMWVTVCVLIVPHTLSITTLMYTGTAQVRQVFPKLTGTPGTARKRKLFLCLPLCLGAISGLPKVRLELLVL